jgi:pimeloyl-ACP methyl ester carboxylesterase
MPFARFGDGGKRLVIFPGLADAAWDVTSNAWNLADHYQHFTDDFTVYVISRRRGLPRGCTTRDMANDYARVFDHELSPCSILGISLGGCIAQHFAADYPEHVQQLILASTAYRVSDAGRKIPERWLELARQNRWREFYFDIAKVTLEEFHHTFFQFLLPLVRVRPHDPTDFLVALEACLTHNGLDALTRIRAPTLLIGGQRDIFFPPSLLRETIHQIPDARLRLIANGRHGAYALQRREFEAASLDFLLGQQSPAKTASNVVHTGT